MQPPTQPRPQPHLFKLVTEVFALECILQQVVQALKAVAEPQRLQGAVKAARQAGPQAWLQTNELAGWLRLAWLRSAAGTLRPSAIIAAPACAEAPAAGWLASRRRRLLTAA